ncbi:hypothetical protein ACDT12_13750 [Staphylococcus aureus]
MIDRDRGSYYDNDADSNYDDNTDSSDDEDIDDSNFELEVARYFNQNSNQNVNGKDSVSNIQIREDRSLGLVTQYISPLLHIVQREISSLG